MFKKISIITVCRNEVQAIDTTLQSILEQTYTNKELIVIDGASTDGTLDKLKAYQQQLAVLISEPDSGIYNAMNKGLTQATGDYVLFMNAGDRFYSPTSLAELAVNFTGDIIYGNTYKDNKAYPGYPIDREFLVISMIDHQATLYKKELFLKYGFYDESLQILADYDFLLKVLLKNKANTVFVDSIISLRDFTGISSSAQYRDAFIAEQQKVQARYFSRAFLAYCAFKYHSPYAKPLFFIDKFVRLFYWRTWERFIKKRLVNVRS